jgi:hypothetical protein
VAAGLFVICVLLTILLIKEDTAVPGIYTGWGAPNMTGVFKVLALRWLVMTAAFVVLLAGGRLTGWAPWAIPRVALALGGVCVLEVSGFFVHSVFADESVQSKYRTIFAVLATTLPLCVMAGAYFSRRWLFVLGVVVAMIAGMYGSSGETKFMRTKKPFLGPRKPNEKIEWLLPSANPMYEPNQLAEVFARIEERPNWIQEAVEQLDGPDHLSAMYVLCRKPARLGEALQERCWTAVGAATVELDKDFQTYGHVTTSEALKMAEAVKSLAAVPGPVRDRHRAVFLAAVDYMKRARADTVQIPDTTTWDWVGK